MADITIQSETIPNYKRTVAPELWVFYSAGFTASDGLTIVSAGNVIDKNVYQRVICTLAGGTVTIPTFMIKPAFATLFIDARQTAR